MVPSFFHVGNRNLFTCSGIIVEFVNGIGYVVTSATLVRCQDENEEAEADELKVSVFFFSILYGICTLSCKH